MKEKDIWIDVHNDDVMIANGLVRCRVVEPRDPSVWTKTKKEKNKLRSVKVPITYDMHFHTIPIKEAKCLSKIIVYLKANKEFPKSTYSKMCYDNKIDEYLDTFLIRSKSGKIVNPVIKYYYNGVTYTLNDVSVSR